ncbi:hypothetical protein [Nocardia sp. alder85J]|uniref:hypothetical protein n=1 Tax=Nocardia sp. alder85J TaxID=2862949 RepID=UPI001CD4E40A|nr:hypothetical protein [Nocardia sp. alder85J]MCX4098399.1 hypothetical protein [Nocardia sp. alder85J]
MVDTPSSAFSPTAATKIIPPPYPTAVRPALPGTLPANSPGALPSDPHPGRGEPLYVLDRDRPRMGDTEPVTGKQNREKNIGRKVVGRNAGRFVDLDSRRIEYFLQITAPV